MSRSWGPVDTVALRADDRLVDALGARVPVVSSDPVVRVLAAWVAGVDATPIPNLVTVAQARAAMASMTGAVGLEDLPRWGAEEDSSDGAAWPARPPGLPVVHPDWRALLDAPLPPAAGPSWPLVCVLVAAAAVLVLLVVALVSS